MSKVLLIEDDLFLRDIYMQVLQAEGFTVLTADDGVSGLALCKQNVDASLVLLDIMLPRMHGIDVLKQVKAAPETAKLMVVMLTNMSEETVVKEAMRLGAYAYLLKVKFTPPELVEKVKEFISFHNTQIQ